MLSDQVKSFDITWRIKCDLLGKLHYGPAYNPAAVSCPDWLCQQCRPCLASARLSSRQSLRLEWIWGDVLSHSHADSVCQDVGREGLLRLVRA